MKKLVLALVCLVSVAFFASCEKEAGIPTINFTSGEGYISTDATIEAMTPFMFGIQAKSNPTTLEPLTKCTLQVFTNEETKVVDTMFVIDNQPQFNFDAQIALPEGVYSFVATVYNDKDMTNECRMTITSNAVNLEVKDITWVRRGSNCQNAEEMAQYGLQWTGRDAYHANIRPLNNDCKLYVINDAADAYNEITTEFQKAVFFSNLMEHAIAVPEYRNISVASAGDKTYNDILAVIDAEGNQHLILFANANVQINTSSFGVQTTITGQVK